jgi:ribonuclease D
MTSELIATDAALADLCRALEGSAWIALDTEFLRERTYYARLCLIQIGAPGIVACVDPLAVERLEPLHALLENPRLRKVLHAARQDIEVFNDLRRAGTRLSRERHDSGDGGGRATPGAVAEDAGSDRGVVAAPLFDTQIAAAYLGYDDQIGYAALVTAITGVLLDKTHTRTDWSKRPLSAAQHQYAEDDVRYLMPVYEALHERLAVAGRLAWVAEDCAHLTDPALYANDPADAWRRLRGGAELPAANQQMLRTLAAFREQTAQSRNLPRGWVLRDEVLFELARRAPHTVAELGAIRGLEDSARERWGDAILASIDDGRRAEPLLIWERQAPPTPDQTTLGKRLMETIRSVAQEHELAPAVLATRRDVDKLVRGAAPASVLRGWRAELLGAKLDVLLPS